MKKFVAFALTVVAVWFFWREPVADWQGMPAAREPVQTASNLPPAFQHEDYTVTPLARYTVTAVVLGRERYRYDREAGLSPVDLALGWGSMSMAGVINELKISQSGRWYEYRWPDEPPLELGQIATLSANTHCLPATKEVRSELLSVKRHELVTLEGYLVEITGPKGYRWRSSLTRADSGARSCEVLWVTGVTRKTL
ncbi:MAG TPA: hypothetical protein VMM36_08830 [Opitutaceae bacterium]|nr:hypothetical protein [Opitutaceae bacterium]